MVSKPVFHIFYHPHTTRFSCVLTVSSSSRVYFPDICIVFIGQVDFDEFLGMMQKKMSDDVRTPTWSVRAVLVHALQLVPP